ncbi:histidine phosphotransferase family protein [Flavimaricola marinus]|uniref:histidine phosphotransferase family protein n=1 Tax=Flavimaricola marinus TaxID=1819565 RepID=UPI0027B900B4|nr:histidine phosphotransferase family protein [Flavimaricola marinus]
MSQTPEMALIEESVQNANARIRFFRVAYGGASPDQSLSRAEITATLLAAARGGRISYLWDVPGDQPRPDVRIAFLLLQCMEAALPMGGEIKVSRDGAVWQIHAETERLRIEEPLWDSLINPRARVNFTAAQVQFALLPEVLAEHDRKLNIAIGQTDIRVQF